MAWSFRSAQGPILRLLPSFRGAWIRWVLVLLLGAPLGAQGAFTPEERAWLAAHPVIRVAYDPSYPPVEFEGSRREPVGLAPEHLAWVATYLGVRLVRVPARNWDEALDLVRRRKADLVTNATLLPERTSYLAFSRPWMELPDVILVRQGGPWIRDLEGLAGRRVAVVKGYASRDWLVSHQPRAVLVDTADLESALKEVSFGTADAAVADLPSASWLIERRGLANLRVAGEVGSPTAVSLACRSDWPELRGLLDKALQAMPQEERMAIRRKWISVPVSGWRPGPRFWAVLGAGAVLTTLVLVLGWNRSLRRQVRARTRELEVELQERLRVQEEKDQFVAMVTHELRTPLTSLQGALDLLEGSDDPRQRGHLLGISQENCGRLIRITNDILDHEKLASRRMGLRIEPLHLPLLLHQSIELNRTYADRLGVALVLDLPPQPLPRVQGDLDRLIQVLTNLLSNAAKWTPRGGAVELSAALAPGGVRVAVADRGPGIPAAFRDRLFQPYEQSQSLPDPRVKGTGLGLAISKILLEYHGAQLDFDSVEGQGTTFFFTLPTAE